MNDTPMLNLDPKFIKNLCTEIKCEKSLKAIIQRMLKAHPYAVKEFKLPFRMAAIKAGLNKYESAFEFDQLINQYQRKQTNQELRTVFSEYHKAKNITDKLWHKNNIMKRYSHVIKNNKQFEQLYEHFFPEKTLVKEKKNLMTINEFEEKQNFEFLIPNLLPKKGLALLAGQDNLKTKMLALDLTYAVISGTPLFNQPTQQGKVIIVALAGNNEELSKSAIISRLKNSESAANNTRFLSHLDKFQDLEKHLQEYQPNLLVFHSLKNLADAWNIPQQSRHLQVLLSNLNTLLTNHNCAGLIVNDLKLAQSNIIMGKTKTKSTIASNSAKLFLESKKLQLILTTFGEDTFHHEYKLSLNYPDCWPTLGFYHLTKEAEEIKRSTPLNRPEDGTNQTSPTTEPVESTDVINEQPESARTLSPPKSEQTEVETSEDMLDQIDYFKPDICEE